MRRLRDLLSPGPASRILPPTGRPGDLDGRVRAAGAAAEGAVVEGAGRMDPANRDRVGCVCGTAMGGIQTLLDGQRTLEERGPERVGPFLMSHFLPNTAAGEIA